MRITKGFTAKKTQCFLLLICWVIPSAMAGGNYTITQHLISNGGGKSNGDGYELTGSIGQVTTSISQDNNFSLSSGFWHENTDLIFKNSFE